MPIQTPSQTVGPFFSFGLILGNDNILINDETKGTRIYLVGKIIDGDGLPVPDAMVEIWQADAQGIYNHPSDPQYEDVDKSFRGFGRSDTVDEGAFSFRTIRPGPVPWTDGGMQAPHINVRVFSRGMLIHAITRIYFSDEEANQTDPVLNSVDPARRGTLIATLEESDDLPRYRLDIHLQGERETVFFNP